MNNDRKKFAIILGLVIACLYLWFWLDHDYAPKSVLHYRLDVTFEIDGQKVTGSGIHKLTVRRLRGSLSSKKALWDVAGEAVIVEPPERPAIFVLMALLGRNGTYTAGRGDGGFRYLVSKACGLLERRGDRDWGEYVRFVGETTGTCNIEGKNIPMMVRFRDEGRPSSVEQVDLDDLGEEFGAGAKFLGVSLTITDGPISTGIRKRLSWIHPTSEVERLTPGFFMTSEPTLPEMLMHKHFRRTR